MTGQFEYAAIRIEDRRRDERLNAGVIIFTGDRVDVRMPRRLEKLRALSGALELDALRADIDSLPTIDADIRESGVLNVADRIDLISQLTPFSFSSIATFHAHDSDAYESSVVRLLRLLVEPEVAPMKQTPKRTRLSSAFRAALRFERILARRGEGLSTHRVVSNVQIADGLAADFVLKNGAMHVIETVDATSDDISLRKVVSDIAVSALVLEQARMTYGQNQTTSRLVYDASANMEKLARPSFDAAAHQGVELVNWASLDDRKQLMDHMASFAEALPTKREKRLASVHASTQSKLALN